MSLFEKIKSLVARDSASGSSSSSPGADRRGGDVSPAVARAAEYRVEAGRETVEAFLVAFILALLFRAFLAEVFVIPTGSMAPTLMGAHKDVFCDQCQCRFEVGASQENRSGAANVVVGGVCPNCRHLNSLDLAGNSDHKTFNGDRIVVNKYAYTLAAPERWDVIVFKFPGNPKQNYIKRLVGLPGETLTLDHGNVYRVTADQPDREILRKPAAKVTSMSHLVHDTDFQSPVLVAADYPCRWQPWRPGADSPPSDTWKIERTAESFTATLPASTAGDRSPDPSQPAWLRYFHRWPNELDWDTAADGGSLAKSDPYAGRAITDFYAYNSAVNVGRREVYQRPRAAAPRGRIGQLVAKVRGLFASVPFNPEYESGGPIDQFNNPNVDPTDAQSTHGIRDGMHWVGELMLTANVSVDPAADSGAKPAADPAAELTLEIVKAGTQYQCVLNLGDGTARFRILREGAPVHWADAAPSATTSIRTGDTVELRFCNYDHQLRLWIDGDELQFDAPTTFDESDFRTRQDDRPHWSPQHPLDASPVGIAASNCSATVDHLRIDRDQYYIATKLGDLDGNTEYDRSSVWRWARGNFRHAIQDSMGQPQTWDTDNFWSARQTQTYALAEGQYFPMGDNSPGSLDARSWAGSKPKLNLPDDIIQDAWRWHDVHYVPHDLLVGKAVFILWPHPWTSPLPITPGFDQIEMIR